MGIESRRAFLGRVTRYGAASALVRTVAAQTRPHTDGPATRPAEVTSTAPTEPTNKSIVAHLRNLDVIAGFEIYERLMIEMVEDGLQMVTATTRPDDAWNKLLSSDDIVGIKFNHVGEDNLATTIPLARGLVNSLGRAGFAPERIVLIEEPKHSEVRKLKTTAPAIGYSGGQVSFGSGQDELAAVLQQVTAIINVPFLKTHNIAGMTGCLKNLSHALVRHPKRYHGNACTPYIGDIIALPQFRAKLKINIVNAIRVVFNKGPAATPEWIYPHRGMLVSADPVAADRVGTDIINEQRLTAKLPPIGDEMARIPHIRAAAGKGLGTDDQDYIDLIEQTLG